MTRNLSPDEYKKLIEKASGQKKSRYRSKKVTIGSHTFDSQKEGKRYSQLFILQKQGEIFNLELQPTFPLIVGGVPIRDARGVVRKYKADFRYQEKTGRLVVEDVKSAITKQDPVYRLKIDIMRVAYPGMEIREV